MFTKFSRFFSKDRGSVATQRIEKEFTRAQIAAREQVHAMNLRLINRHLG